MTESTSRMDPRLHALSGRQRHTVRSPHLTLELQRSLGRGANPDGTVAAAYFLSEADRLCWSVAAPGGEIRGLYPTPAAAIARARQLLDEARRAAEWRATAEQWRRWVDRIGEEDRAACAARRTAAELLALPEGRAAVAGCVRAGKAYSGPAEYYARRPVVREAVRLLAARAARRADRSTSEAARATAPGRVLAEGRRRQAERREQLLAETRAAVREAAGGLYRVSQTRWAGGDHSTRVEFGAPSCSGRGVKAWSRNGKWSGSDSEHTLRVGEDWLQSVHAAGLAALGGMLTLSARPVPGRGDGLYEAAWAEQGRGFELNAVRGYIAVRGGEAYHAPSAAAALRGLARKLAGTAPARRALDLDRVLRKYGGVPVTLQDSLDCGNCESGTHSWCRAVGIDPDAPACPLAAVIAGQRLRPLAEALRVIRRVVRDARNRQSAPADPVAIALRGAAAQGDAVAAAALADRLAGA